MKALALLAALVLVTLMSEGCARTYISRGDRSPDQDTEVVLTCHGAWGRAYADESRKLVDVWIGPLDNSKTLFSHRYKYVGSDLYWHTDWHSSNDVTVDLYDYGEGVLASDGQKAGAPSNHIAELQFQRDSEAGKFEEKKP